MIVAYVVVHKHGFDMEIGVFKTKENSGFWVKSWKSHVILIGINMLLRYNHAGIISRFFKGDFEWFGMDFLGFSIS